MVRRVSWTRKALSDLRGIYDYIAQDSKNYAQIQVERIKAAALRAGEFPESGRVVPEAPHQGWREILTGNYRILYRIVDKKGRVLILAVVHGRQLLKESMIGRD